MSYFANLAVDDGSDVDKLGDGERRQIYTDIEGIKYADKDYETLIKLIW